MWGYLLLLLVAFGLLLLSLIYMVRLCQRLLKNHLKESKKVYILSFIPVLFFIVGFIIDPVNTIVIYVYLILLIGLCKLVFLLVNKITKKSIDERIIFRTGLLLTIITLLYGYYQVYHVVETNYKIITSKDIETDMFRIVQISDSHLGNTINGKKFINYMKKINKLNPDIVVITGDFIDDNTSYKDMIAGSKGLGNLKTKYGVYFVYGNHDKGYYNSRGYTNVELRKELKKNDVKILEDKIVNITEKIVLIGRQDASIKNRISAEELTNRIDKNKYIIALDHQPTDYDNEIKAHMDLVLSGHTHGGQLFPIGQFSVLLGINDKVYGVEKRNKTNFIVNSGISDWALKFKTGTVSEYCVIDIKKIKRLKLV